MITEHDREHYDSMMNRLESINDALAVYPGRKGRQAGMAATILAMCAEVELTVAQAWKTLQDPRWESPVFTAFIAQRHAELAFAYAIIQTAYDELCDYGMVPREMRSELTTKELAAIAAAEEREAKRRARSGRRSKVAA